MSKYGIQPAHQIVREQRWTTPALAERINVPPTHLRGALLGHTAPSPALRDRLPAVLGVPLSKLFTTEVLEAKYHPGRGPGGRVRPGQTWLTNWDE